MEQFLITTIIARTLFTLRKALKSAQDASTLEECINQSLGIQPGNIAPGMRSFAAKIIDAVRTGRLPYIREERLTRVEELPLVNVVIEESPSVLNPECMRFDSIFRDISPQVRKFGIGLTVISQQVSAIGQGILTQLNSEVILALGNESERHQEVLRPTFMVLKRNCR